MTTVRLIKNSYPFLKGTEFIVTGGDNGFWSRYAFHSGTVIANGEERRISVERSDCEYIKPKDYKGTVILEESYLNPKPMSDQDYWDDWINSPG
jgi:hypothetical protein